MKSLPILAATLLMSVSAGSVSAATFTYFDTIWEPNECGSVGFDSCSYQDSPTIAKYDYNDGVYQSNQTNGTVFPSIDGSEFSITLDTEASGSWSYTAGASDPTVVTAFMVKAGNGYSIYHWDSGSGTDYNDIVWDTSRLGSGLSHITFFDTGMPSEVPLPAAGILLLGSLGAFGAIRRRRKS